jgi:hypothetical protein
MTQALPPFLSTPDDSDFSAVTKPLSVILTPSGSAAIAVGETFTLSVTLRNQGNLGAIIDVYIDETSQPLRQWCAAPRVRLALDTQQSTEVTFQFQIPLQALPGSYSYVLVVDAPEHYPEATPIRHSAQLQILPSIATAIQGSDPTFGLQPLTSSQQPLVIQPGVPQEISIVVNNRSHRVDRFRLTCPDLPDSWFRLLYPVGLQNLGLVSENDNLALNPGTKGEIRLVLSLPGQVDAGRYLFTLQLISTNHPELVLMEVLYLQVLARYDVRLELQTLVATVKQQPGLFYVLVNNLGNTARELKLTVCEQREDSLCAYTLSPAHVRVEARETRRLNLEVQPTRRRPWWGKGRIIPFHLSATDHHQLPDPQSVSGEITWEARPWWHLLLVILAGGGAIATLLFLLWWAFFRPPAPPQVLSFGSESSTYEEVNGDFIDLNWQISNPQHIQRISLTGQGNNPTEPQSYDFSQGIPAELRDVCVMHQQLICRNIRTDARKAGDYEFQLTVQSKGGSTTAIAATTSPIRILPVPAPRIVEFTSAQPTYVAVESSNQSPSNQAATRSTSKSILLNWKIMAPGGIQSLSLVGRSPDGSVNSPRQRYRFENGIPTELLPYCQLNQQLLICRNVPIAEAQPGSYSFELNVTTPQTPDGLSQKTDTIKVLPPDVPTRIVYFHIDGKEALPKYQLRWTQHRPTTLSLSWKITGSSGTQAALLPSPGTIPLAGSLKYPLSLTSPSETLLLQVTTPSGQTIQRSVIVEVIAPTPAVSPQPVSVQISLPSNSRDGRSGDTPRKPSSDKAHRRAGF